MNEDIEKLLEEFTIANVERYNSIEDCMMAFFEKYSPEILPFTSDPIINEAYAILEQAYSATNEKEAKMLAEQAYDLTSDCMEAGLLLVDLEEDIVMKEELLLTLLSTEEKKLRGAGLFTPENIGEFYQIIETRVYISLLTNAVNLYLSLGKIGLAKMYALDILHLNTEDNTGARYILMAIYSYFEDEEKLLELYHKESYDCLQNLVPLLLFYYKKGDYDAVHQYIKRIHIANKYFIDFIRNWVLHNFDIPLDSHFTTGELSEVTMVFNTFRFLFLSVDPFLDYLVNY